MKERADNLNDLENMRRDTEEGIDEDEQFRQEYDNIERDLKNHHPYRGEIKLKQSE